MSVLRLHRRFSAWLAMLALVLGALAPTVTQAMMASGDRADWVEVCSVSGMVWVKVGAEDRGDLPPASGTPTGDAPQHCAWCTLQAGVAGLPEAQVGFPLPVCRSDFTPGFYLAPMAASAWMPVHSRGPPSAS